MVGVLKINRTNRQAKHAKIRVGFSGGVCGVYSLWTKFNISVQDEMEKHTASV